MVYRVPYNYLPEQFKDAETFFELWRPILSSGEFTLGPFVEEFERNFAEYMGAKYCVATNNGTDALILSLKSFGIKEGDEVITPCNSFYATTGSIVAVGAKPVFADVDERYQININQIEKLISNRTKAILPVHWAGASPDMCKLVEIARAYNLLVVEDACMAIGGKWNNSNPGTYADVSAFSMHPLKTLNVAGDGGMITTNNKKTYEWLIKYRNHGMTNRDRIEFWGVNARLQPLQAAVANHFLKSVDEYIKVRNSNALYLDSLLSDLEDKITLPPRIIENLETFSLYMILAKNRDNLLNYLQNNGVDVKIHYPVPLHLQPAAVKLGLNSGRLATAENQAKHLLTIPVHQYLNHTHMDIISELIHDFYKNTSAV